MESQQHDMESQQQPLVSVLVPIYNVEKYIERCCRSLFEQTYSNLEYVFVDDCSPDRSIDILENIVKEYPHRKSQVHIIHHEHNRGIAATRNTLIDNSHGEFITFVDSDDWVEKDMVEILMQTQQDTDTDIITVLHHVYYPNRTVLNKFKGNNFSKKEYIEMILGFKMKTGVWGRLIRRSLYIDNNIRCLEGVNMSEDFQVTPLLFHFSKKFLTIDKHLYHYDRTNPISYVSTFMSDPNKQNQTFRSLSYTKDFFLDKNYNLDGLYRYATKLHYQIMQYNFGEKNKKEYNKHSKAIQCIDNKYWDSSIGWHNPIKRFLESHYSLMRLTWPIRSIRMKMHQRKNKST